MPYGYICGFPVAGLSSELYGYVRGTMTNRGTQSEAVVEATRRWGRASDDGSAATELHVPVCKRGYIPFDADGNRMYGCGTHSHARRARMLTPEGELYLRPGWERFDQWDDSTSRASP